MGSCMAKPKVVPRTERMKTSVDLAPRYSAQNIDVGKLVALREKFLVMTDLLDRLHQKAEDQAKMLIKKHRGNKGLFTLKKVKLYEMLLQDVQAQTKLLENSIIGKGVAHSEVQKIEADAQALLFELDEVTRLEEPMRPGETLKDREVRFKQAFKVREIENELIFAAFAKYEAEANDITLTTSGTFTRSDVKTQPSSQDSLDN